MDGSSEISRDMSFRAHSALYGPMRRPGQLPACLGSLLPAYQGESFSATSRLLCRVIGRVIQWIQRGFRLHLSLETHR